MHVKPSTLRDASIKSIGQSYSSDVEVEMTTGNLQQTKRWVKQQGLQELPSTCCERIEMEFKVQS